MTDYERGQRDALAAAVQRVEALLNNWGWNPHWVARVIAAIMGGDHD